MKATDSKNSSQDKPVLNYFILALSSIKISKEGELFYEKPFFLHLVQLRQELEKQTGREVNLLIGAPFKLLEGTEDAVNLCRLSDDARLISCPLLNKSKGVFHFWLKDAWLIWKNLYALIKESEIVHLCLAHELWKPYPFIALILSIMFKKPIVYVVDIDFRKAASMQYKAGLLSFKSYILRKLIYDPFKTMQMKIAARYGALMLLKGGAISDYYKKITKRSKNFLNASYSHDLIIPEAELQKKIAAVLNPSEPLRLVYYGNLVFYKGITLMPQVLAKAKTLTERKIELHIFGKGSEEERVKETAASLHLRERVFFHGHYPYGKVFFDKLYPMHLLLAMPLSEDSARSALDAMAAGIGIISFDTYYYHELVATGAVETVPWNSTEQMAIRIAELANKPQTIENMIHCGVSFARRNTQDIWLRQRVVWTLEMYNELNKKGKV